MTPLQPDDSKRLPNSASELAATAALAPDVDVLWTQAQALGCPAIPGRVAAGAAAWLAIIDELDPQGRAEVARALADLETAPEPEVIDEHEVIDPEPASSQEEEVTVRLSPASRDALVALLKTVLALRR